MNRFVRNTVFLLLGVLLGAAISVAYAGSSKITLPHKRNQMACIYLVHNHAQAIAYYRWVVDRPEKDLLDMEFDDEMPDWTRTLITDWIKEAYAYQGTPQAWLQKLLAECDGVES